MATVSKEIADDIRFGKYAEDEPTRIVQYTDIGGKLAYGVTFGRDDTEKYMRESEYIRNPTVYWDHRIS